MIARPLSVTLSTLLAKPFAKPFAKPVAREPGLEGHARCSASETAERVLIERIAGKDREALRALYQRYYLRLYGFLMRLTHQAELAEEVLNDVMFVVWQKAATYNAQCRVSTWILGIAYRQGLGVLAQIKRRTSLVILDEEVLLQAQDTKLELDTEELLDWLNKGLGRLSPEHRMVVELTHFLGYSYDEIAAIADCPVGTVKTRMFHARKQLRNILTRLAGVSGDDLVRSHDQS